tara:strand:- start:224836 stop:225708 length:873 start_codon:yes stop_codon:yes gene_type:complete
MSKFALAQRIILSTPIALTLTKDTQMKIKMTSIKKSLAWSTLFVTLFNFNAFAGADGSGGGNDIRSTETEVRLAIKNLKPNLIELLKVYQIHYKKLSDGSVLSQKYNEFYKASDQEETPISIWSVENSNFIIKQDSPCVDKQGQEKDASVMGEVKPGGPICFSLNRLQRIPPNDLNKRLLALGGHELAHQILETFDEKFPEDLQYQIINGYDWTMNKALDCRVHSFRDFKGEVTGYQIYLTNLQNCSGGCGYAYSFDKSELSKYIELARKPRKDALGRMVRCEKFSFEKK